MTEYQAEFERDESRGWLARVPSIPGCQTYGRSLRQARRRLREALALWIEEAEAAQLEESIRLPRRARAALARCKAARRRAEQQRQAADEATAEAVRALVEQVGLSIRDAGELLGLSHQRVAQLTAE